MLYLSVIGQVIHLYRCYVSLEGEGWLYPIFWSFSTRPLLFACICLHGFITTFVILLALFHTQIIAINMNTNESKYRYKYSHFWRRIGPVDHSQAPPVENGQPILTEFEFVNPFDEGIMKNCYNFWMGTPLKDINGASKMKYIELKPMGAESELHEH
jgi:hypothetical protein